MSRSNASSRGRAIPDDNVLTHQWAQFEVNNRLLVREATRADKNCNRLVGYWKALSASAEAFHEQAATVQPMQASLKTIHREILDLQGEMDKLVDALQLARKRKEARKLVLWEQHRKESLQAATQRKSMLDRYKSATTSSSSSAASAVTESAIVEQAQEEVQRSAPKEEEEEEEKQEQLPQHDEQKAEEELP